MNRLQEIEAQNLVDQLEAVCRRLPKGTLSARTAGVTKFPAVKLFGEIHDILNRLATLRGHA